MAQDIVAMPSVGEVADVLEQLMQRTGWPR